jgi:protein SCO1/2
MRRRIALAAAALGLAGAATVACGAAAPGGQRLDPRAAIELSERAIGRTLGGYTLIDAAGAALRLHDYRGKPLVISTVYTSCSSVCPATTQHLLDAVGEAGRMIGLDQFNVLTVGFDARHDTPARLTEFAARQGIRSASWRLASAGGATIEALLRDLGFSYAAVAGGFDHVTLTTIVDRDGRIYRQVYGDDFPLPVFIEPLKDVVYGRSTVASLRGLIDRVKLICTVYDPASRRYQIDYGLAVGSVLGGLSLLVMAGLIAREWRRAGHA